MKVPESLRGVFPLAADSAAAALLEPAGASSWQAPGQGAAVLGGTPRWTDAALERRARECGDAQTLLEGYQREGAAVLRHLGGAFVAVVSDARAGRLLLAVDRLGIGRMCYARGRDGIVFSPRADVVAGHPAIKAGLSAQGLYNYLYFHVLAAPGTIFEGVRRLLPGEALEVVDGEPRTFSYWRPAYPESARGEPAAALQAGFRELVEEAVRTAAADTGSVGCFLSGGTDSSTVVGMLARATGTAVDAYSIGFDAPGYDEMEYARIAAKRFGARLHEHYVTPEALVDAIPHVAGHPDEPFGNASVVPAWFCARMAREDGRDCLLAGDGGDELFGGNYRYAKQQLFEHYRRVPAVLRTGLVEPALLGLPAMAGIPGVRKLRNYVAQARIPMPDRLESYNLLERLGVAALLTPRWLDGVDAGQPLAWLRECYHEVEARSMINRMLAVDMRFTLADSDLPKVGQACELAGIAVRFPLLDDRLVAFAATLPADQKVRGTRLRHLFKEALRGFLPDEIIAKRKHGFGLPFGVWLQQHAGLRALAGDSLQALAARGILRREAVGRLLDDRHHDHPAYYGTFIWILMMLEQWLARHGERHAWS